MDKKLEELFDKHFVTLFLLGIAAGFVIALLVD